MLVAYLFAVTYWRPYIAKVDNLLAMGSLFGKHDTWPPSSTSMSASCQHLILRLVLVCDL